MVLDDGTVHRARCHILTDLPAASRTKSRQRNEYHAIHNRWNSLLLLRARLKLCDEFLGGAQSYTPIAYEVPYFFEEVGTFFRAGLLPHEILWQNLGRSVIIFWRLMEPETRRVRLETGNRHLGSESEYLAGEMLAYGYRKGAPHPCPDASGGSFVRSASARRCITRSRWRSIWRRSVDARSLSDLPKNDALRLHGTSLNAFVTPSIIVGALELPNFWAFSESPTDS
jgi:hypothetical protein